MKKLFGKRLKNLRIKNNLTQEQLAEKIKIGERNLSKIECGVNFVSADTLSKIAEALNVTIKDLFDFEHLKENEIKKEEIINAIKNESLDIELLYKIYQAIKK